tara:strand:+ start:1137 stop:1490 length:354 start_codon:yes stop_codon:yes gene_type:complete
MMEIKINELRLFGYHGVYDEEKKNGQEFVISTVVTVSSIPREDNISDAIDYSLIIEDIKEVFEAKRYNLIETLALDISNRILINKRVSSIKVSVKKENPPINADIDSVAVVYEAIQK